MTILETKEEPKDHNYTPKEETTGPKFLPYDAGKGLIYWRCQKCDFTSNYRHSANEHFENKHKKVRYFFCKEEECDFSSFHKSTLNQGS